jgi:hypothetical protein
VKRLIALLMTAAFLIGATGDSSQVCTDYLFAGRPAPDVSPGFYVERIVCLTPDDHMEPVDHPTDIPGLQAMNEALLMELLATQRLAEERLKQINKLIASGNGYLQFHPVVYIYEEHGAIIR